MIPITTATQVQELRSQSRAVVLLWVNWAVQARQSEILASDLEQAWLEFTDCPTRFYRADLSDQEGEVWEAMREWLQSEQCHVERLTVTGYGALLWVRNGHVAASVPYAAKLARKQLLRVTGVFFECPVS